MILRFLEQLRKANFTKPFVSFFAVPYFIGMFLIAKVFYLHDCYGFDMMDGAVLTSPNLAISAQILRTGQIPMMNVFNNFGTPILGDAFTLPFALQSWTYYLLPHPIAATLNRFAISFCTVSLLTLYYKKRFSSYLISTLCAILVFFTPAPFFSMPTHHYQMALFSQILIMLLQEKFTETHAFRHYIYLYLAWLIVILSCNIQLTVLIAAFSIVHQFFLTGKNTRKSGFLLLAAMGAAFIAAIPEIYSFFQNIHSSQVVHANYNMPVTPERLWVAALAGIKSYESSAYRVGVLNYHEILIYISFPIILAFGAGLYKLWRKNDFRGFWEAIILGVLPVAVALLFLQFPKLFWSFPIIRSTDITRLFWFSSVFIIFPAGIVLQSLKDSEWSQQELFGISLSSLLVLMVSCFFIPWREISWFYKSPVLFLVLFIPAAFFSATISKKKPL